MGVDDSGRGRKRALGALAALGAIASLSLAAASAEALVGSSGLGDSIFPGAGNGGYDVYSYNLNLGYMRDRTDPVEIDATMRIRARAVQNLDRFNLDLHGPLQVGRVKVNGARATVRRVGAELRITPAHQLERDKPFKVVVPYHGVPTPRRGSFPPSDVMPPRDGWQTSDDGTIVIAEPYGASTWMPVNDHPQDVALWRIKATVPSSLAAISNGQLRSRVRHGNRTTWSWRTDQPRPIYLATLAVGHYRIFDQRVAKLPTMIAIEDAVGRYPVKRLMHQMTAAIALLRRELGPFPAIQTGAIVQTVFEDYIFETYTRPTYGEHPPEKWQVVHELAHEYFGNSVRLADWSETWLNEGPTTWAEWLDSDRATGTRHRSFASSFASIYNQHSKSDPFWQIAIGAPDNEVDLFSDSVYLRGGMTLYALQLKVGEPTMLEIMRTWIRDYSGQPVRTEDFIALAELISGQDLSGLFNDWLYTPAKPPDPRPAVQRLRSEVTARLCPIAGISRAVNDLVCSLNIPPYLTPDGAG